jgi:hypothetical protein
MTKTEAVAYALAALFGLAVWAGIGWLVLG